MPTSGQSCTGPSPGTHPDSNPFFPSFDLIPQKRRKNYKVCREKGDFLPSQRQNIPSLSLMHRISPRAFSFLHTAAPLLHLIFHHLFLFTSKLLLPSPFFPNFKVSSERHTLLAMRRQIRHEFPSVSFFSGRYKINLIRLNKANLS